MGTRLVRVVLQSSMVLALAAPSGAVAQQPLETFLRAADEAALDAREARAALDQARSQANEARARLLPSVTAVASYTRNQYEVQFMLPGSDMQVVISPQDQLEARFQLNVPLIDLTAWAAFFQSEVLTDAADARLENTRLTVEGSVVQFWHQLVASRALLDAARRNLETIESSRAVAAARVEVGVSPQLELARADAERARARQTLAEAELSVTLAERDLENLTGLAPTTQPAVLDDDLHREPPLDQFLARVDQLPQVRAAQREVRSAELGVDQGWLALLPTINGTATERITNAAGFSPQETWALGINATWTLDFVLAASVETRGASLAGSRVRSERAVQAAETGVFESWHRVQSTIARVDAARAAEDASTRAAEDARIRFESGAATQLDQIQADRDRFQAEVNLIQAVADLRVARAALQIRSGLSLLE